MYNVQQVSRLFCASITSKTTQCCTAALPRWTTSKVELKLRQANQVNSRSLATFCNLHPAVACVRGQTSVDYYTLKTEYRTHLNVKVYLSRLPDAIGVRAGFGSWQLPGKSCWHNISYNTAIRGCLETKY